MALTTKTPSVAPPPAATARIGNYRWTVCALLFFATTINYIDRQVLAGRGREIRGRAAQVAQLDAVPVGELTEPWIVAGIFQLSEIFTRVGDANVKDPSGSDVNGVGTGMIIPSRYRLYAPVKGSV